MAPQLNASLEAIKEAQAGISAWRQHSARG
jgi:hypothetical protein